MHSDGQSEGQDSHYPRADNRGRSQALSVLGRWGRGPQQGGPQLQPSSLPPGGQSGGGRVRRALAPLGAGAHGAHSTRSRSFLVYLSQIAKAVNSSTFYHTKRSGICC